MKITTTARHFSLTKALQDYIEDSCSKLERYFDHIINVHFILTRENNRSHVEMVLHVPKNNFTSEAEDNDMYVAISDAVEKMEAQIKKLKEKWSNHKKKSLFDNSMIFHANLIEKTKERKTVKIKRMVAEPMTVEEALDYFEQQKEPYFVFKNLETDRINVLIQKDKEHFKLIQP